MGCIFTVAWHIFRLVVAKRERLVAEEGVAIDIGVLLCARTFESGIKLW